MKVICFYLPQFHEIPENDEWWGKGFTEWVNVKKAKPLFKGHEQPRVPLNKNYATYCLRKRRYGRQRLPASMVCTVFAIITTGLMASCCSKSQWRICSTIRMLISRSCICWANEPWTKAWVGETKVLIPQHYGEKKNGPNISTTCCSSLRILVTSQKMANLSWSSTVSYRLPECLIIGKILLRKMASRV